MYTHELTLQPNLQHAIECVERPGGSHEGVGRKKDSGVSSTSLEALAFSKGVVGHCL